MTNRDLLDTLDKEAAARIFIWLMQIEYKYTKNPRGPNLTKWMKKKATAKSFQILCLNRLTNEYIDL